VGRLTTHVLDTAGGCPGSGIEISLYRLDTTPSLLVKTVTNHDGRTDQPLAEGDALLPGRYEIHFRVGAYFQSKGLDLPDPPFVDDVVLRFGVADASAHYHVPLLVSPWSYSTYRGS